MPRCFGQLVGMQARRLLTAQTSTQTETENSSTSSTVNVLTYHNDVGRTGRTAWWFLGYCSSSVAVMLLARLCDPTSYVSKLWKERTMGSPYRACVIFRNYCRIHRSVTIETQARSIFLAI